jgi:hypothetical protein
MRMAVSLRGFTDVDVFFCFKSGSTKNAHSKAARREGENTRDLHAARKGTNSAREGDGNTRLVAKSGARGVDRGGWGWRNI